MNDKRIILVGGGTRSGKSRFALDLARKLGKKRLFVATGQAKDEEMTERIRKHQETRGPDFSTLEEPLTLSETLAKVKDTDDLDIYGAYLEPPELMLGQHHRRIIIREHHTEKPLGTERK